MATSNDIKNGLCIKFNHDIYKVVEFQHVKPGKGAAFVRTKLKSLSTGRILENTFPQDTRSNPYVSKTANTSSCTTTETITTS